MLMLSFKQEFMLRMRRPVQCLQPVLLLLFSGILFGTALGSEANLLRNSAPAIIWVLVLLSSQLTLDQLFTEDYQQGILEQWLLFPEHLITRVVGKLLAHWLASAFPVLLASLPLGLMFGLSFKTVLIMALTLLLGTPILLLLGAMVAALAAVLPNQGVLLALLVLPLTVPIMIFSIAAMSMTGEAQVAALQMLAALLLVMLSMGPWMIGKALKLGLA